MRLENKTVIVTGAGSGLGKAVAVAAAKEGAAVVLADINEDAMNKMCIRDSLYTNSEFP